MSANMISFPETLEQKLQLLLQPVAIYCFSSHHSTFSVQDSLQDVAAVKTSAHYKVLVIVVSHKPNAVADTANIVRDSFPGITVSILLHRISELKLANGDQQFFFHSVMGRAGYVSKAAGTTLIVPFQETPCREVRAAKAFWEKSYRIALHYLEAAVSSEEKGYGHIGISWLHQVVEHAALGAVRVFLGYSPNHFSLGYLLGLCGDALDSRHYFPLETETGQQLFHLLSHPSTLRHRVVLSAPSEDYNALLERCGKFLENTKNCCTRELARLETIFSITIKTN